jgi:HB1, ASXL, restriction endonuclease HTH domain
MGCKELIGAMAGKGYWMSPGGKTPSATLFSAIAREIATKGDRARFTKAGPGRFGPRRA